MSIQGSIARQVRGGCATIATIAAGCIVASAAQAAGPPAPPSMAAGWPDVTVLAKSAQQVGVRRCYPAVDAVSTRMLENTRHADVVLDWDRRNPDGEPFFALTGLEYASASAMLSLTTVPEAAGGCTMLVERISTAPVSCKTVAATELRGYQGSALVKAVTVYVDASRPRETVTLMDIPSACLIVRRQVQFGWGAAR